jgi:thioredoxin-like negative regulator of GroEL
MAAAMAAGCQDEGIRLLKSDAEFAKAVNSPRPVLVDFFKAGCPTCGALEPILDTLEKQYRGRADFCRLELVRSGFVVTSPQLQSRYQIDAYPTVILFVKGAEVRRWEMRLEIDVYRKALDEALRH